MKDKDQECWRNRVLPIEEVKKLYRFIKSWDSRFQGTPPLIKEAYEKIFPMLKQLEAKKIQDIDLTEIEFKGKIESIFNRMTRCTPEHALHQYESTDASKILHTILPHLFVMWDRRIRDGILGSENRMYGDIYAWEFLPKMQRELEEAIQTCMKERKLDRVGAINFITDMCESKTLAKLADQHNYMVYTMPENFLEYVKEELERSPCKQYEILTQKLNEIIVLKSISTIQRPSKEYLERKRHQEEFEQFVQLLNKLKTRGLITGIQWREYSYQWRDFPQSRDFLVERLKRVLKEK